MAPFSLIRSFECLSIPLSRNPLLADSRLTRSAEAELQKPLRRHMRRIPPARPQSPSHNSFV
ncbi:protein of unknown function [Burkholderia multivorans]